jgi:hypothetical protein
MSIVLHRQRFAVSVVAILLPSVALFFSQIETTAPPDDSGEPQASADVVTVPLDEAPAVDSEETSHGMEGDSQTQTGDSGVSHEQQLLLVRLERALHRAEQLVGKNDQDANWKSRLAIESFCQFFASALAPAIAVFVGYRFWLDRHLTLPKSLSHATNSTENGITQSSRLHNTVSGRLLMSRSYAKSSKYHDEVIKIPPTLSESQLSKVT